MTNEMCIDYCVSKGAIYAGTQYGEECYCGTNAPPADRMGFAKCGMPCAGNSTQTCGDAAKLSVYTKNVSPVAGSEIQSVPAMSSSSATIAATASSPPGGYVATASTPPSSFITSGSSSTVIPTSTSLSFAVFGLTDTVTVSKAFSTTTTINRSSTTTFVVGTASDSGATSTSLPSAIPSETLTGWVSKGCWIDPVNPRALETWGYWGEKITTSGCIKWCDSKGFTYAGTEYAGQCFCSNDFAVPGGQAQPDSDCNMPCEGNPAEICGGSARLSLFQKSSGSVKREPISYRGNRRYRG